VPNSGLMDKENVAYIHNGILLKYKEECNYVVFRKMDGSRDHILQDKLN
jgi:hypothetical protein